MKTGFFQKTSLVLFGVLLCVVMLEVGMRIGGFVISSLQYYRNTALYKQSGTFRIICFGESTTAGGQEAYPAQLQEVLNQGNAGMRFSVFNLGIPGIDTSDVVRSLEDNLTRYKPDMVITMIGINDQGTHMPYHAMDDPRYLKIIKSFRVYKVFSLLRAHCVGKFAELFRKRDTAATAPAKPSVAQDDFELNGLRAVNVRNASSAREPLKEDEKFYINAGWSAQKNGDCSLAEEYFKKALELSPRKDEIYISLGWLYRHWNRSIPDGERAFRQAVAFNPRNYQAYIGLGELYFLLRDYVRAEEVFNKAIAVDAQQNQAYLRLGDVYSQQDRYPDALRAYAQAQKLITRPDSQFFGALGILHRMSGNSHAANEYFGKAEKYTLENYNPITRSNYQTIKQKVRAQGIPLVCIQYPLCSVESLKKIVGEGPNILFVDNAKVFKDALKHAPYKEYFRDMFAGSFGHCTREGNRLLAENIASVIMREYFYVRPGGK